MTELDNLKGKRKRRIGISPSENNPNERKTKQTKKETDKIKKGSGVY
jgi:hypothetical protein